MSWLSANDPSVSLEAYEAVLNPVSALNPAAYNPVAWPAHDMDDGLDLPTFDLFLKCVVETGATSDVQLGVPQQQVAVGRGASFNVLRRSHLAIRKYAKQVEFQGLLRVSYAKLKPFIQELLVLHHPYLQRKKVVIGLVGFAWDIKNGLSDLLSLATPALDLEFAKYGNLAQYLSSKALSQSLSERRMLCHQVLTGLSCLHDCHIVHGDLKMENILVCSSEDGSGIVAKLSDFGFSMFVIEKDSNLKKLPSGTEPWNSPEWKELRPSRDFHKSDIYSAGLLIWAVFSIGEDPFHLEGHNIIAEPELPSDSDSNQRELEIENLKKSDEIVKIASRTTIATFASFDKSPLLQKTILRSKSHGEQSLLKALTIVFENTLQLNPMLRSLQPAIEALHTRSNSVILHETEDKSSTLWGAMYLNPRQISPKSFQLASLRSSNYIKFPGAPTVARLSVAISRAIFDDSNSFTVERRRDAAFFLFRSYFENYGIEENQHNIKQAIYWLHEFAKLGIASDAEDLCFAVAEYTRRIDPDVSIDFPLETCLRAGLQSLFKSGLYLLSVCHERTVDIPNFLDSEFLNFKKEGLRRLLPQQFRSAKLSAVLPAIGSDNTTVKAAALFHIAASCGDIHAASLLVEKHNVDLNVRENFGDITPLVTALKFSQTEFVLWLLRNGVRAGIEDQGIPVLCFICNFVPESISTICSALCEAGASVNDTWYFEHIFVTMNMLSFAAWTSDLASIDAMLVQQPSKLHCEHALQWACCCGRLNVIKKLESHLTSILKSPPDRSIWEGGFSNVISLSPYHKLCLVHRPDFIGTTKYIIERIGGELKPEALCAWVKIAIRAGDCESLNLCFEQDGSMEFLRRSQRHDLKNNSKVLEKSALEWSIVLDRKAAFDILIAKGSPFELEQAEGNFPTLLHCVAQRDLINGKYICNVLLAKGDKLEVESSKKLSGVTALEVAMRYNNYEIADILLGKGACVDGFGLNRLTPLGELIASQSHDAIDGIKFLLEHPQASPAFVVDPEHGRTALHIASGPDCDSDWQYQIGLDDHEAILDMIIAYFNEPKHLNARDKCGFTALHHATYRGCNWAVKKLLKAGADPNLHSCLGIRPLDCAQHPWGLSMALDLASPNFNVSSPASQDRREAARRECAELLIATGAGNIVDSLENLGFRRFIMGGFGLINNAKEDHDVYEPWTGEFGFTSVTKWIVKQRNKKSQARIAT